MQALRGLSLRWALLGTFVIATVVFITYFPSLRIGFWMDDYWQIDLAGRLSTLDHLVKYFDPRVQWLWYRPMIGMQWKVEYLLFRGEPFGYHFVQVTFHVVNCLLLYWLVTRATQKWRIGLVAALVFATFSLSSMAIYWTSVHDPLVGVLYLLTIVLWMGYVESGSRVKFALAFATLLGALLTKEVSVTLPMMLFLADRLLVNKPARFADLVKRYALFVVPLAIYAWFQLIVMTRSEFTQQIGYRVSEGMLYVFARFLSLLAFPGEVNEWLHYIGLVVALVLFIFFALTRERKLWFLGGAAILPTLIAAPIPSHLFNPRYLYLPLMASAVGYSLLLELALDAMRYWQGRMAARAVLTLGVVFVICVGSATIGERTENFGGYIRQVRMTFRPIYQQYPTLPPDTFLYFIDTPLQTQDISGLMLLRYGTQVTVSGVDRGTVSGLRDHNAAFVWYLDEQGQFQTQEVAKEMQAQITLALPVQFGNGIMLDELEIVKDRVKSGEAVVVLMRWKAITHIDSDYTLFAHLVNQQGEIVASSDSQPRKGLAPTTSWRIGSVLADSIVIPMTERVATGPNYSLEIGWYYLPTLERLLPVNSAGQPIGDRIIIRPLVVE